MGVHIAVAQELVGRAVEMAGPGAGDDIDLAASCSAHLGRITARLDLELLHRVGRRAQILGAEGRVGVGGAVEQKVICIGAASADAYRRPLARPPIKRTHVSDRRAVADVCARNGKNQVDQHAAIQRQRIHRPLIHHLAHARILCLEQLARGLNRDSLGIGAEVQLQVESGLLAYFKVHGLLSLLESGTIDSQRIRTRLQTRNLIQSGGV